MYTLNVPLSFFSKRAALDGLSRQAVEVSTSAERLAVLNRIFIKEQIKIQQRRVTRVTVMTFADATRVRIFSSQSQPNAKAPVVYRNLNHGVAPTQLE